MERATKERDVYESTALYPFPVNMLDITYNLFLEINHPFVIRYPTSGMKIGYFICEKFMVY